MKRNAVVAGATGLVGARLVTLLCDAPDYGRVLALTRRPLARAHPKLETRIADFDHLARELHDARRGDPDPTEVDVFCCLGTTIKVAGSEAAFRRVDFDYVLALGAWARTVGARRMIVVSALGADAASRFFYNRVKGEMEQALAALGLRSLVVLHPSLIDGDRPDARSIERLAIVGLRPMRALVPRTWRPVRVDDVAATMLEAARMDRPPALFDNADLHGRAGRAAGGRRALCMLLAAAACALAPAPRDAFAQPRRDGTLIVLNKGGASASFFDVASGNELARLPTDAGPHEAAVSPDGRWLVVANYGQATGGHTLTVIDVTSPRIERTIDLGEYRRPHGVQFVDARSVAVTAEAQRALLLVDVQDGKVTAALRTEQNVSHMVALAPDRKRAYVANLGSGGLTAIELGSGKLLAQVPTGRGAEGIDVTPDGREIWVSNRDADTISIVDATKLQAVAHLDAPGFPIRVRFTPDGRRALVTVARADALLVFDVASRKLERRVALPSARTETEGRLLGNLAGSTVPIGVVTDATGRLAFVAQANADQVALIDVDAGSTVATLRTGKEPDGMAWSPVVIRRR
jgi:DNA-binding beta-propeller fold protein YncE